MTDPKTALHYAPNANVDGSGNYVPGSDGFNLADVSSINEVSVLPPSVQALVYLGLTDGADANFQNIIRPFIGNPKVFGFYLADEPIPGSVSAANLKAESDWIHANDPGTKTFIVEYNSGSETNPSFAFTPANTGIDLYGLDPYPIQTQFSGGANLTTIADAVSTAEADGIGQSQIVPVYQAFGGGGYASYTLPTVSQEQQILSSWGAVVPNPVFDFAYSWGSQSGDTALVNDVALQQVFAAHNSAAGPAPGPTPPPPTLPAPLTPTAPPTLTAGVPAYDHVVVVVMENHDYNEIIGDSSAPFINNLAASGELLTNYLDTGSHPSEPNYLGLYAGSTFGVTDDNYHSQQDPTLATILQGAGKTFTGYVEGGATDQNHNPWEYFPEGTSVESDFSTFPMSNLASLPTVSFVIPNLNDDMHNGTVAAGDIWLQANMNAYAQWAKTNNSLLVVTWDEGSTSDHVPAILVGAGVTPGSTDGTLYSHYNMLSTILAASNLTGSHNAATAAPIAITTQTPTPIPTPPPAPTPAPAPIPVVIQGGTFGSGADTLTVTLAEDAYQGDAQANVAIDGTLLTATPVTVTALNTGGNSEVFNFKGNFGSGSHTVAVSFLNDAYGGTPSTDRNLYVNGITLDGQASPALAGGPAAMDSAGTSTFGVSGGTTAPTPAPTPTPDSLTLDVSEDAWQGDAQFTIQVDGRTIGSPQTAFASHAAGQSQAYLVNGNFGAGPHQVGVTFTNDAYGGTPSTDRNLYLDGVQFDSKTFLNTPVPLFGNGSQSVQVDASAAGLSSQPQLSLIQPAIIIPLN